MMPDLSEPEHPDRQTWLAEISQTLNNADLNQLVIVGHSLGVTAALDFLEQATSQINGLLSVSGFAEDYGADFNSYFLREKSIDFKKAKNNLGWAVAIYGDNDPYAAQTALRHLADDLGVEPIIIANGGHLNTEAGFTKFPQLVDILEKANS